MSKDKTEPRVRTLADFKVGDGVRICSDDWTSHPRGTVGTVCAVGHMPTLPANRSKYVWVEANHVNNPYRPDELDLLPRIEDDLAARCLKACEGINPEAVPELVAVLEEAVGPYDDNGGFRMHAEWDRLVDKFRAALAKAKGGAQ